MYMQLDKGGISMRVVKLIGGLFCALMTAAGVYNTFQEPSMSNFLLTVAFAVLTWMLLIRKPGKKRKSKQAPATASAPAKPRQKPVAVPAKPAPAPVPVSAKPAPAPVPVSAKPVPAPVPVSAKPVAWSSKKVLRYKGKIVGTSFDGHQKDLAWLMEKEKDYEVVDYYLEESTYNGKPSIKVMADIVYDDVRPKHIGFIAAKDVDKVLPLISTTTVEVELYGGPDAGYDEEESQDYLYGGSISLYT